MYCPKCGTKCEDTHYFCYKCGFLLPFSTESDPIPTEEPVTEETPVEEISEVAEEAVSEETTEAVEEAVTEDPPEAAEEIVPTVAPAAEPVPAAPMPKRGRLWPPALVLGIMMVLGLVLYFLFPNIQSNTPEPVEGTPWFSVHNGALSFDASLYTGSTELEVPETIDGQTVTVISEDCFKDCTTLTTVILPSTLTEIDDRAFSGCSSLRGIYIPEGVKRIGNRAFAECASLEAIHLPASVTTIADRALFRCPKLVHIFYAGPYENWEGLYNGSMPNNTWVYCEDGNFPYERN